MKLLVKSDYHNTATGVQLAAGEREVSDAVGAAVLLDAPENFTVIPETKIEKAFDEPAQDKQVKAAPRKK